jgi:hypothetical protein
MDSLLAKAGPAVTNAVRQGIEEALQNHHPNPRFMGGAANQALVPLRQSLHQNFHSALRSALKDVGFPNVGGRGGAARDWAAHFRANPGSYDKAMQILRQVSRDFDKANGTSISKYLERELARGARNGGQK